MTQLESLGLGAAQVQFQSEGVYPKKSLQQTSELVSEGRMLLVTIQGKNKLICTGDLAWYIYRKLG